jgi:hypothetical protein
MKSTIALISVLILSSCTPKPSSDLSNATHAIDEAKTKEVFDHHFKAFTENDLEAVMADYTDESILITPDVTYNGLAEIRANFVSAFKLFPKDSTTFKVSKSVIKKDLAYFIWSAKTPKFELGFGTDTFVIQNGKIIRQSFAGH